MKRIARQLALSLPLIAGVGAGLGANEALAEPTAEKVSERVTKGAVDQSLESLASEANRDRLAQLLTSKEMRESLQAVTAAIVTGAMEGISRAHPDGLLSLPKDMGKSFDQAMDKHVTPALTKITRTLVHVSIDAAMTPEHREQYAALIESSAYAGARGMAQGIDAEIGPAIAATLERDIGPAVRTVIARDVIPALGEGLESPEMQAAISRVAIRAMRDAVYGANEGIDTAQKVDQMQGEDSTLNIFGQRVALGYAIALLLAFTFATLFIVMTVLLVRSGRRQRRMAEQSRKRDDALMDMLDSIEAEGGEVHTDVRKFVRNQVTHA